MTELEELEEVFFYPPPPLSHLPHLERTCSFVLQPLPGPPKAFSAKKMSTLTARGKPQGCNFLQTKQNSKISYKPIAWQVYWFRFTIPWNNQSKKRNRFPRASAETKWGSFLAVFIEFGSLALTATLLPNYKKPQSILSILLCLCMVHELTRITINRLPLIIRGKTIISNTCIAHWKSCTKYLAL